jgi:RNA polymerase sigma-70 factor, ECF subfamily
LSVVPCGGSRIGVKSAVVLSPDGKLVARARQGDRDAYRVLVERYQRRVYHLAYSLLRNREDAADVSQEAFVKVFLHLSTFKGDSSFATWLFRIANNLSIDLIRRRGTSASVEFEEDAAATVEGSELQGAGIAAHLAANPQRQTLRRELGEKLEGALARLPEKHRAILLLREIEGFSYEQIAEALEIPAGTVMSRLFHARAKMQKLLSDYMAEDKHEANVKGG